MSLNLDFADYAIRPLEAGDADMTLGWRNQPHVREGMFHSRAFTREEHVRWMSERLANPTCHYWIFLFRGEPRGLFGVYDIKPDQRVGEWVYYMAPRDASVPRGNGAAMEFLAIDTFFQATGIRRLWGQTLKSNERVWRMHERFGFRIEGALREHVLKDGALIDMLFVGMLREEWAARRGRMFAEVFSDTSVLPPWSEGEGS